MAKASKNSVGGVSLLGKDATSGGGTEGALATIAEIGFVDEFTYGGRQKDKPQAALRVVFEIDGFDKPWEQHYTVGPSDKWESVEDGDGIRSLGKATGLNKNCVARLVLGSIEAAAEAQDIDIDELLPEMEGGGRSVRPLEGRSVRLTNTKYELPNGDTKEAICIASFEAEDDAPKGKSGKSGAKKGGASIEEATGEIVRSLLEDTASIKKGDLGNLVYQADRKNPDIKAMMQLCFKDSFLGSIEGVEFDKKRGVVKAAE
jgi:hypothetical protein